MSIRLIPSTGISTLANTSLNIKESSPYAINAKINHHHQRLRPYLYTASKVKHHLNIFLEKTVKLSKHEFIFVTCLKRDKVVTIYSKFWFDYHLGKRSGKENAHSALKISRFSTPLWHFQTDRRCILLVLYCYNTKDMVCLKISDEYL